MVNREYDALRMGGPERRRELDYLRNFHDGRFGRCPSCGSAVFLPCLACELRRRGKENDPFDMPPGGSTDELRIQLQGEERRRYEYLRLQKVAETLRHESRETENQSQ